MDGKPVQLMQFDAVDVDGVAYNAGIRQGDVVPDYSGIFIYEAIEAKRGEQIELRLGTLHGKSMTIGGVRTVTLSVPLAQVP